MHMFDALENRNDAEAPKATMIMGKEQNEIVDKCSRKKPRQLVSSYGGCDGLSVMISPTKGYDGSIVGAEHDDYPSRGRSTPITMMMLNVGVQKTGTRTNTTTSSL